MLPMDETLLDMIDQAMKDKAPQIYRRLKVSGDLQVEIERRARGARESYLAALEIQSKGDVLAAQNLPPLEQVAERTMARRAAAETALAAATEFPSESESDEDC